MQNVVFLGCYDGGLKGDFGILQRLDFVVCKSLVTQMRDDGLGPFFFRAIFV